MKHRVRLIRSTCAVMALFVLAACGSSTDTSHMASNGTPDEWWSDNYLAMLQDAQDVNGAPPAPKQTSRMRLF